MKHLNTIILSSVLSMGFLTCSAAPQASNAAQFGAALLAAQKATDAMIYQYDPNLSTTVDINSQISNIQSNLESESQTNTLKHSYNTMLEPAEAASASLASANPNSPRNLLPKLGALPKSFTLNKTNANLQQEVASLSITSGQPSTPSSSSADEAAAGYSFSSLISPLSYAPDTTAPSEYLAYMNKAYSPIFGNSDLDFSQIPTALASKLGRSALSSPIMQTFWANLRNLVAQKSVANSNFYYLISERTPSLKLGESIGLRHPISPLEASSYLANQRRNATWYKQMNAASPAVVQRQTLYVLSEIEHQLFQNHLTQDRILGTLSAMELQNTADTALALKTESRRVKQIISTAASKTNEQRTAAQGVQNRKAMSILNKEGGGNA